MYACNLSTHLGGWGKKGGEFKTGLKSLRPTLKIPTTKRMFLCSVFKKKRH